MAARHSKQIDVFRCKKCMSASTELDDCQAARPLEKSNIVTEESFIQANETPLNYAKRLVKENKTPEEIRYALKLIGIKVDEPSVITKVIGEESLPEGWTKDSEGRIESPVSIEDILAKNHSEKKG